MSDEEQSENVVQAFSESLEKVIEGLASRFGRWPTENEIYRFIWGTPESREWIFKNKGLPENQR